MVQWIWIFRHTLPSPESCLFWMFTGTGIPGNQNQRVPSRYCFTHIQLFSLEPFPFQGIYFWISSNACFGNG